MLLKSVNDWSKLFRTIFVTRRIVTPWRLRPEENPGANQRGTHDNGTNTQSELVGLHEIEYRA